MLFACPSSNIPSGHLKLCRSRRDFGLVFWFTQPTIKGGRLIAPQFLGLSSCQYSRSSTSMRSYTYDTTSYSSGRLFIHGFISSIVALVVSRLGQQPLCLFQDDGKGIRPLLKSPPLSMIRSMRFAWIRLLSRFESNLTS